MANRGSSRLKFRRRLHRNKNGMLIKQDDVDLILLLCICSFHENTDAKFAINRLPIYPAAGGKPACPSPTRVVKVQFRSTSDSGTVRIDGMAAAVRQTICDVQAVGVRHSILLTKWTKWTWTPLELKTTLMFVCSQLCWHKRFAFSWLLIIVPVIVLQENYHYQIRDLFPHQTPKVAFSQHLAYVIVCSKPAVCHCTV